MDVDWNAEVVDQLESHWRHQLRPRLDGLTDDEYFWQPVPGCWTISRRGASSAPRSFGAGEFRMDFGAPPHAREPVTTIAWRLAHLIVGFAETSGSHFGGPPAHVSTFHYAGTAGEALRQLDDTHQTWVEGVRALETAGLARAQGLAQPPEFANEPMAKLILHTNVEVIHHGAEICLLRDLYQRKRPPISSLSLLIPSYSTSRRRSRKFCPLCTLRDHFNVRNAPEISTRKLCKVNRRCWRATGTPARVRCGFAGYLEAGRWIDHWVVEYWDDGGWRLIDPEIRWRQ